MGQHSTGVDSMGRGEALRPRCFSFNPFSASMYAPIVMALRGLRKSCPKMPRIDRDIESRAHGSRELPPRRFDRSLRRT